MVCHDHNSCGSPFSIESKPCFLTKTIQYHICIASQIRCRITTIPKKVVNHILIKPAPSVQVFYTDRYIQMSGRKSVAESSTPMLEAKYLSVGLLTAKANTHVARSKYSIVSCNFPDFDMFESNLCFTSLTRFWITPVLLPLEMRNFHMLLFASLSSS